MNINPEYCKACNKMYDVRCIDLPTKDRDKLICPCKAVIREYNEAATYYVIGPTDQENHEAEAC